MNDFNHTARDIGREGCFDILKYKLRTYVSGIENNHHQLDSSFCNPLPPYHLEPLLPGPPSEDASLVSFSVRKRCLSEDLLLRNLDLYFKVSSVVKIRHMPKTSKKLIAFEGNARFR